MFIWMVFLGSRRACAPSTPRGSRCSSPWSRCLLRRLALPIYVDRLCSSSSHGAGPGSAWLRQQMMMNEIDRHARPVPSWVIGAVIPISALVAAVGTWARSATGGESIAVGTRRRHERLHAAIVRRPRGIGIPWRFRSPCSGVLAIVRSFTSTPLTLLLREHVLVDELVPAGRGAALHSRRPLMERGSVADRIFDFAQAAGRLACPAASVT